jgi:hypothetical protein
VEAERQVFMQRDDGPMSYEDWVEWLAIYGLDASKAEEWSRMAYERWGRSMSFWDELTSDDGISDLEDSFIRLCISEPDCRLAEDGW